MLRSSDVEHLAANSEEEPSKLKKTAQEDTDDDACLQARKYVELGLGRGVDITNPQMWKNKTAIVVRQPKLKPESNANIVVTEESGVLERYEKMVSTVSIAQRNLRLSLDDPSSQVKIGVDAQQTQSTNHFVKISGTKVKTRTISFHTDAGSIPCSDHMDSEELQSETCDSKQLRKFYNCMWKRIQTRGSADQLAKYLETTDKSTQESSIESADIVIPVQEAPQESSGESADSKATQESSSESANIGTDKSPGKAPGQSKMKIMCHIRRLLQIKNNEIKFSKDQDASNAKHFADIEIVELRLDCRTFLEHLGMTHFICAIELGALKYSASMVTTKQIKFGGGASVGHGSKVKGEYATESLLQRFESSKEEQMIGRIGEDGSVKRELKDHEAVIGFQIQPIYSLVQVPGLQKILQQVTKEYMLEKADKSEGPFLISCNIGNQDVYWKVRHIPNSNHRELWGTTAKEHASHFFIVPTNDPQNPSEFLIAFWPTERNRLMSVKDPIVQIRKEPRTLPLYLFTGKNIFCKNDGPLQLKPTVLIEDARFALHSRVQSFFTCMMCLSTPVCLSDWLEGEEFYIKCSRRAFKLDGYVAMCKSLDSKSTHNGLRRGPDDSKVESRTDSASQDKPTDTETATTEDGNITGRAQSDSKWCACTAPIPDMKEGSGMLFRLHHPSKLFKKLQEAETINQLVSESARTEVQQAENESSETAAQAEIESGGTEKQVVTECTGEVYRRRLRQLDNNTYVGMPAPYCNIFEKDDWQHHM